MFGKNPIEKADHKSGAELRIVKGSPFYTIQGEGPFSGQPAIFIRLHGCNLRCWFCDTEFSDEDNPIIQTVELARACYNMVNLNGAKGNLVVITGGEPLRQNIAPLCKHLLSQGYTVQIETAGTLWPAALGELYDTMDCSKLHFVVSPKTGTVHPEVLKRAMYFKYVVGSDVEFKQGVFFADTQKTGNQRPLAMPSEDLVPKRLIYVSPCDEQDAEKNKRNLERIRHLSLTQGFIVSLQVHKYLNIL